MTKQERIIDEYKTVLNKYYSYVVAQMEVTQNLEQLLNKLMDIVEEIKSNI